MTATTTRVTEGEVYQWPEVEGVSAEAVPFLPIAWARIESYIAHRWPERAVTFTVEGPGTWAPPLRPVAIETVETWDGEGWQETTLPPSPYGGFVLPDCGPFRFTGSAGDDDADAPTLVLAAVRRLAEYFAQASGDVSPPGARSSTISVNDVGSLAIERAATWQAMALQASGAADLLRSFRR